MVFDFRYTRWGGALKIGIFAIGANYYTRFNIRARMVKNQMMFNDDDYCKSLILSIGFICISLTIYD